MLREPAVEFERVVKAYPAGWLGRRRVAALRDVSLAIPRGTVFGLVGPNRAGKTTLVKLLLSLCRPTAGQVRRLGRAASDRRTLARVGYLHESQAFGRYLSAGTLLEYYGVLSEVPRHELRTRIPRLLEQVGLADRAHEPIVRFSKGMVQRLALAQALINEPELLVLDEPTEGMDLSARQMLHEVVRSCRQRQATVLLISHSLHDVEQLCDEVAVLRLGELAFVGPISELTSGGSADPAGLEQALAPLYAAVTP
ncbi:MAG TPA: ABC transporter ATP-binding protein [Pirellulales bacterium]|jgi:ABC-2 type transport system ATP-binding protein|nr:ABC transporter ATP-binding protein [Pirellulales bacterium]